MRKERIIFVFCHYCGELLSFKFPAVENFLEDRDGNNCNLAKNLNKFESKTKNRVQLLIQRTDRIAPNKPSDCNERGIASMSKDNYNVKSNESRIIDNLHNFRGVFAEKTHNSQDSDEQSIIEANIEGNAKQNLDAEKSACGRYRISIDYVYDVKEEHKPVDDASMQHLIELLNDTRSSNRTGSKTAILSKMKPLLRGILSYLVDLNFHDQIESKNMNAPHVAEDDIINDIDSEIASSSESQNDAHPGEQSEPVLESVNDPSFFSTFSVNLLKPGEFENTNVSDDDTDGELGRVFKFLETIKEGEKKALHPEKPQQISKQFYPEDESESWISSRSPEFIIENDLESDAAVKSLENVTYFNQSGSKIDSESIKASDFYLEVGEMDIDDYDTSLELLAEPSVVVKVMDKTDSSYDDSETKNENESYPQTILAQFIIEKSLNASSKISLKSDDDDEISTDELDHVLHLQRHMRESERLLLNIKKPSLVDKSKLVEKDCESWISPENKMKSFSEVEDIFDDEKENLKNDKTSLNVLSFDNDVIKSQESSDNSSGDSIDNEIQEERNKFNSLLKNNQDMCEKNVDYAIDSNFPAVLEDISLLLSKCEVTDTNSLFFIKKRASKIKTSDDDFLLGNYENAEKSIDEGFSAKKLSEESEIETLASGIVSLCIAHSLDKISRDTGKSSSHSCSTSNIKDENTETGMLANTCEQFPQNTLGICSAKFNDFPVVDKIRHSNPEDIAKPVNRTTTIKISTHSGSNTPDNKIEVFTKVDENTTVINLPFGKISDAGSIAKHVEISNKSALTIEGELSENHTGIGENSSGYIQTFKVGLNISRVDNILNDVHPPPSSSYPIIDIPVSSEARIDNEFEDTKERNSSASSYLHEESKKLKTKNSLFLTTLSQSADRYCPHEESPRKDRPSHCTKNKFRDDRQDRQIRKHCSSVSSGIKAVQLCGKAGEMHKFRPPKRQQSFSEMCRMVEKTKPMIVKSQIHKIIFDNNFLERLSTVRFRNNGQNAHSKIGRPKTTSARNAGYHGNNIHEL